MLFLGKCRTVPSSTTSTTLLLGRPNYWSFMIRGNGAEAGDYKRSQSNLPLLRSVPRCRGMPQQ